MTAPQTTRPLSPAQRACLERLAAGDVLCGRRDFGGDTWRYLWASNRSDGPRECTLHVLWQRGLLRYERAETIWERVARATAAGRAAVAAEVAR